MSGGNVRPTVQRLTDSDARKLLAEGLIRTCHEMRGPSRVALETGCDEKTIRRARDEETTLGLACVVNLIGLPGNPLSDLMAARGVQIVPIAPQGGSDRECESKLLKAALALSIALQDDQVTPAEVRANRATIEAARDALDGLLAKLSPRSAA